MNFVISSSKLLKQLVQLNGVINSSNTLPILDNFYFEIGKDEILISASDLETTVSSKVEAKSDSEGKGFSAKLWSIDLTGYNERLIETETDGSDPSWSTLLTK